MNHPHSPNCIYQALNSKIRCASVRYLEPCGGFLRNRVCSTSTAPTTPSWCWFVCPSDLKSAPRRENVNCIKRLPSIMGKDIGVAFVQVTGPEFGTLLLVVRTGFGHVMHMHKKKFFLNN